MVASAALGTPPDQQEPTPSRNELLARYRHLREISKQHHLAMMKLISRDAVLRHACGLGLTAGMTLNHLLDGTQHVSRQYNV
jgi:hypothetical protein